MWAMSPNGDGMSDTIKDEVRAAHKEGREVRLTEEQMESLGHGKRSLLKVIRSFCIACMGGSRREVRLCTSPGCSHWPYRNGKNPYRAEPTEAQRLASIESAKTHGFSGQRGQGTIQTGLGSPKGKEG
jgi:hypothetical protein